jgi:MFS family permease
MEGTRGTTRAVVGAVVTTTASVLPVFLTAALAVQISDELGFDAAGLGVVVALYFGVSAFASLPTGWIVERVGPTTTSRIAVVGAAGLMLAIAFGARSYGLLVTILMCSCWCNVMGQLSSNLTLARFVPARRLGLSFGFKQSCVPLATLLSGLAVPTLALTVGWRWAFIAGAGLALLALPLTPRSPERYVRTRVDPAERATGALAVIGVGAGLGAASAGALGAFLVVSAVRQGVDPGLAGLVLTLGSVVGLAMRLVNGWLADRRAGGHIAVVAASMAIGAIGVALLAVPGPLALVLGTVVAFGIGWGWTGLLQFAVVRLNPGAPAAATSVVQVGTYAGAFLGPMVFGLLATHAGFPAAWLTCAGMLVLAAVAMIGGRRMLVAHRDARQAVAAAATVS